MLIRELKLKNFRNFKNQEVQFQNHVNILVGDNGQGKTNLVEAIYFLSRGKSFRTHNLDSLVQHKEKQMRIDASIEKEDSFHNIHTFINEGKKEIFWNNKKISSFKAYRNLPTVVFSPESLSALKEGPEARRELIDETLLIENSEHIKMLHDFKKILRTKNVVLKKFKAGELSKNQLDDLLMSIQPIFLDKSEELIRARYRTIQEISPYFRDYFEKITHSAKSHEGSVDISVGYVTKEENKGKNVDEICNTLRKDLIDSCSQKWQNELNSGLCLYGPHKHDVVFYFDGYDSRYYVSQGQQRALILAFKLTQILYHRLIYGYYPILILDDVLSELDSAKRAFLIQFLSENEAQTFLTTTDVGLLGDLQKREQKNKGIRIYKILSGKVEDNRE